MQGYQMKAPKRMKVNLADSILLPMTKAHLLKIKILLNQAVLG